MYISEEQIQAVIQVLRENELKLSDGYEHLDNLVELDDVLREIAIEIIEKLNEVIYYHGT